MKSMNKYLLLTSSAMIVARVASAALETDAKENKAVVNKLEFNRKYSELTPPTLVIPPFSSAKDYKRLAGICFLGVGDCGSGITFGKGDDYTKPCETINPCTGFNLTNTASCTDGYTTCNTGCEDKFKCNPPQYTQTCEFPYQGVGTPKDGKYKSCECQAAFKYGTGDCPSPKVPDTSGTSCDGKYSSCICPSTYTEYCSSPYVGVGDSCDGKYQSCQCPATYTRDCESEGMSGVGDACNGLYEDCTTIACDEAYRPATIRIRAKEIPATANTSHAVVPLLSRKAVRLLMSASDSPVTGCISHALVRTITTKPVTDKIRSVRPVTAYIQTARTRAARNWAIRKPATRLRKASERPATASTSHANAVPTWSAATRQAAA